MAANVGHSALWPRMDDSSPARMTSADMIEGLRWRTNFCRAGLVLCTLAAVVGCSKEPADPPSATAKAKLGSLQTARDENPKPQTAKSPSRESALQRYPAEELARGGELRRIPLDFPPPPVARGEAAPLESRLPANPELQHIPPPPDAEPSAHARGNFRTGVIRLPKPEQELDEPSHESVELDTDVVGSHPSEALDGWALEPWPTAHTHAETADNAEATETVTERAPAVEPLRENHKHEIRVTEASLRRLPVVEVQSVTTLEAAAPPSHSPNTPGLAHAVQGTAMRAVNVRTAAIIRHAFSLAHRGAQYSARAELIEALRMISQALDMQTGDRRHSEALANAFRALEEAADFIPQGTSLEANLNMSILADGHKTPVLKGDDGSQVTPLAALQRYYTYAQEQLIVAGGSERNASVALYGLGRLESLMNKQTVGGLSGGAPQAMVYHQAALMVDPANYKAANELGVLLARYGQYEEAREVLVHSVRAKPQPESWRNLATVHEQLGQHELARLAAQESQLAAGHRTSPGAYADALVRWVEPDELASMDAGDESHIPAPIQPAATRTPGDARTNATPASQRGSSRGLMGLLPWIRGE